MIVVNLYYERCCRKREIPEILSATRFYPVLLFLLLISYQSHAQLNQEVASTSYNTPSQASINFDKLLNRYHWDTRLYYNRMFGPLSVNLRQNFLSSLVWTDRKFIRDGHTLDFMVKHPFVRWLGGKFQASSYSLSDNQNIALGNAGSHSFQYGIEYFPVERFSLEPMLGIRYDNQAGFYDNGMTYSLGLNSYDLQIGGYGFTINGVNERALLHPRTVETFRDTLGISKTFFDKSRVQFAFSYMRNKREFYLGNTLSNSTGGFILPNIETRTENVLAFSNAFDYSAMKTLQFDFQSLFVSRDVGRATRVQSSTQTNFSLLSPGIEEFRIEGDAGMRFTPGKTFSLTTRLGYLEREERHTVLESDAVSRFSVDSASGVQERKNNHARRTSLSGDIFFTPTFSDTFRLSFSNSLLNYDTPSPLNDDDRDELRHNIRLITIHQINQYLHLQTTAEVSLTHLVYLTRFRSSDNTWNRIFRLSPRLHYTPVRSFTTLNTFEVLANYTAYDFEYLSSSVRSFTFRQFAWIDSTNWQITKRLSLEWFSNIRFYERGELRWEQFSERPLTSIEENTYTSAVRSRVSEFLFFSIGIRYFSQSRFAYTGAEKRQEFFLRSMGPTTAIEWSVGSRTRLLVKGWYESLRQTGQQQNNNANMTMECSIQL
ncbi:MAG: hypothetical protein HYZ33_01530 [Ignavibacteriales bacterium]|nr:hypothetical protein [Ignavibacteriales bacterium]